MLLSVIPSAYASGGKLSGWNVVTTNDQIAICERSTDAMLGDYSASFVNLAKVGTADVVTLSTSISVEPDKTYAIGAYCKVNGCTRAEMQIGNGAVYSLIPISSKYDWTKFQYNYKTGENETSVALSFSPVL